MSETDQLETGPEKSLPGDGPTFTGKPTEDAKMSEKAMLEKMQDGLQTTKAAQTSHPPQLDDSEDKKLFAEQMQTRLKREAQDMANQFMARLPDVKLTAQEADDVAFATHQCLAATHLAAVARTDGEKADAHALLAEGKAILMNVAAIKAKDAETLIIDLLSKFWMRVIHFLMQGVVAL